MANKHITITNGELTGQCLPSALKLWERNGWTVLDHGDSEPDSTDEADTQAEPDQLSLLDSDYEE